MSETPQERLRYHVTGAIERGEAEAITEIPALTNDGRQWAERQAATSIVARIALAGYESGWPEHHVITATQACNAMAVGK